MQTLPNGTILGEYTLIRLIGRGGMGEVYEAHEAKLNRRVALKIIAPMRPDEHDQEDLFRRFIQEARTLAQVNHPNIVTIYNIDRIGNAQFIAMEYVPGLSIKQILKETPVSTEEAIPIFAQILEGLTCLHDNHIIHRDLKPHNILVRKDGQVKILDFGIAKQMIPGAGEGTSVGVIAGTLPYMAPEVRIGEPAHPGSDIYSLGAIFYEILIGRPLARVKMDFPESTDVPYNQDALVRIPDGIRKIINKMCAHDPKQRYSRTTQVMEDLKHFRQSHPSTPPEVYQSLVKKIEDLTVKQIRETGGDASFTSARLSPAATELRLSHERRKARRKKRNPYSDYAPVALLALIVLSAGAIWWSIQSNSGQFKKFDQPMPQPVIPNRFTQNTAPQVPTPTPTPTPTPVNTAPQATTPPQASTSARISLLAPKDLDVLWLDPNDIPSFSWTHPISAKDYAVQIASDEKFRRLVVSGFANGNSFRPEKELKEGIYFWRLNPNQSWAPTIGPNKFILAYLSPVSLLSPKSGMVSELRPRTDTVKLNFSWKCKLGSKAYRVEVSQTPDFATSQVQDTTQACHLKNVALPAGKYYWRVGFTPTTNHNALWSESHTFAVRPAQEVKPKTKEFLDRPKIKTPLIQYTMAFKGQPRDLASLHKSMVSAPVLRWTPVKGASSYQLQFSLNKDFSEILSEEPATNSSFEWKYVLPGKTFWRVRALSARGAMGKFSARGLVVSSLPAPSLSPIYKFKEPEKEDSPLQINWSPIPLAEKYLFKMGPTRNLAKVEESELVSSNLILDNTPGHYYVAVAAADADGNPISSYSKPAAVVIEAAFKLGATKNVTPGDGARAPASSDGRISVKFTWAPVKDAESYSIELAADPEFKQVIQKLRTPQSFYLLKQAELKGRVYWHVRPESSRGPGEWSEPTHFEVR